MTDNYTQAAENWLKAQIEHWQALASGGASGGSESWTDLISKYQNTSFKDLPEQHAELLSMISSQSARFTEFAESLLQQQGKQPEIDSLIEQFSTIYASADH